MLQMNIGMDRLMLSMMIVSCCPYRNFKRPIQS